MPRPEYCATLILWYETKHWALSTRTSLLIRLQLGRIVDVAKLDMSVQQLICGRHRKNIKLIESSTGTAIYFPPMFSPIYRYCPPTGTRRDPSDVFISGETPQAIEMAKLVPTRATHPELKTFAQQVIADQQREVAQLEGWLKAWYGVDKPMDMPMAGMDKMMQALMALNGADFEQAWLTMMVHHHIEHVIVSIRLL